MKKLKEETVINFAIAYIKSYKPEKIIRKQKAFYVVLWSEHNNDVHFRELPAADYVSTVEEAEESFKVHYNANAPIYLVIVRWDNLRGALVAEPVV